MIQQPYLQQYGYNAQGQPQFIMPGNIQLQSGVNPTIQVHLCLFLAFFSHNWFNLKTHNV